LSTTTVTTQFTTKTKV